MKCDLKDFDRGMIVGARQDCLCISSNLLAFSCTTVARMYKERCEKKKKVRSRSVGKNALLSRAVQRRMTGLVQSGRKVTIAQITMPYNNAIQKIISEHTSHWTLMWMQQKNKLSSFPVKNRKLRHVNLIEEASPGTTNLDSVLRHVDGRACMHGWQV